MAVKVHPEFANQSDRRALAYYESSQYFPLDDYGTYRTPGECAEIEAARRRKEIRDMDLDPSKYTLAERCRLYKRMAANMAKMIAWPHEDKMIRASGACVCMKCGHNYFDHPEENGLHLICDGTLVKL